MTTRENLGPAERIIQTALAYTDHMVHNRPGVVVRDGSTTVGVSWSPCTWKLENGVKNVYRLTQVAGKKGKPKTIRTVIGQLQDDGVTVKQGFTTVGRYQKPGIFPEVAVWLYRQIADVWKLDNEFAARWASHAFGQEHRDLKVALAAFMLVQSRKGDPVLDAGKVAFHDEDFRDVGEAMILLYRRDGKDLNPKLLLRVYELLTLPAVAAINRELGFGTSARKPFLGRWPKAVEKWLKFREENPRLLEGLVKSAFRTTVMELAERIGYKPETPKFFEMLRWKQKNTDDGRRTIAIGHALTTAESWEGLGETQICERIVRDRPNWKRIVGLVPKNIGVTRAIMAAAVEAGSLSDKDLIIATPTLEELGLLQVPAIKTRWETAVKAADDMRAANIATRVKSKETKEKLEEGADKALQKAVEESVRDMRIYVFIDISGSMAPAIEAAKKNLARFLQAFPPERIHVAVFNTAGRLVNIPHASAAGVENAFRGISAGGGTNYAGALDAVKHLRPKPEEDVVFIWIGDEQNGGGHTITAATRRTGFNPLAFGLMRVIGSDGGVQRCVQVSAQELGIPCFMIDERTFADAYAIPRTIRALIAATPVGVRETAAPRVTLVDTILKTELLKKPVWAA
jgi:hypothetical protein